MNLNEINVAFRSFENLEKLFESSVSLLTTPTANTVSAFSPFNIGIILDIKNKETFGKTMLTVIHIREFPLSVLFVTSREILFGMQ